MSNLSVLTIPYSGCTAATRHLHQMQGTLTVPTLGPSPAPALATTREVPTSPPRPPSHHAKSKKPSSKWCSTQTRQPTSSPPPATLFIALTQTPLLPLPLRYSHVPKHPLEARAELRAPRRNKLEARAELRAPPRGKGGAQSTTKKHQTQETL